MTSAVRSVNADQFERLPGGEHEVFDIADVGGQSVQRGLVGEVDGRTAGALWQFGQRAVDAGLTARHHDR